MGCQGHIGCQEVFSFSLEEWRMELVSMYVFSKLVSSSSLEEISFYNELEFIY